MLNFLGTMATEALGKYRTTLEEDKHLLATEKLSYNAFNCVQLRIGEKEVLKEIIKFAESIKILMQYMPQVGRRMTLQEIQMMTDHFPFNLYRAFIMNNVYKVVVNQSLKH